MMWKQQWKWKRPGKKRAVWMAAGGVIAAAVVFVIFMQERRGNMVSGEAGALRTAQVTTGSIVSELSSSGVISPKNTYSITSLVEGEVITADFEEGDQVTEGQVLYQIR